MALFGAHMSVAGGLHLAFERLQKVQGEALQIFTRNQRQWRAAPVTDEEAALFAEAWAQAGKPVVASHDSYLINLASNNEETAAKSKGALTGELGRCRALGIPWLVMHPGSHLGDGIEQGINRFVKNLDDVLADTDLGPVQILLENTAGQGSNLGASFTELAAIIDQSRHSDRLGVCFDTCHAFAAGYDISTPEGYDEVFKEFDRRIGINRLKFFHLNDSIKGLGSRIDRHTHIGQGEIGIEGFRRLVNDRCFSSLPMVLETPKSDDLVDDIKNLQVLRSLLRHG